jgi:hypothetical protein
MFGSARSLPNADMQVKHLCKGKVPPLLPFFSSQRFDHDKHHNGDESQGRQLIDPAEEAGGMREPVGGKLALPTDQSHVKNTKSEHQ